MGNDQGGGQCLQNSDQSFFRYLIQASAALAVGDYVKPATDGSGRGAKGTLADHCGRALGDTAAAGQLVECQIVKHVHA